MWDGPRKMKPWSEAWNFQPIPHPLGRGVELGDHINDQLRLCDEASIKVPKAQDSEVLAGEHSHTLAEWYTATPQAKTLWASDFSRPHPRYLFIRLLIHILQYPV